MMILITLRLPEEMLKEIEDLVAKGIFSSRAEAIREGIRLLLKHYREVKKVGYSGN